MTVSSLENSLFAQLASALTLLHKEQSCSFSSLELCVAYSGGLDSSALLLLLTRWQHHATQAASFPPVVLSAVHVNHGISDNAKQWQRFCEAQCKAYNVPLHVTELSLIKRKQHSLEQDARDARYTAFEQHAGARKIVVLAQHQHDQLETILLQLKRGAGIDGLGAMPVTHTRRDTQYLRPLLNVPQQQLLDYAKLHKLEWIEDESNQDIQFDRNFLRQSVLPEMLARWPQLAKTASRSASLCAQSALVNKEYMKLLAARTLSEDKAIELDALLGLSEHTQRSFVWYWLSQVLSVSCTQAQTDELVELATNEQQNKGMLVFGSMAVEKFQGRLIPTLLTNEQLSIIEGGQQLRSFDVADVTINLSAQSRWILNQQYQLVSTPETSDSNTNENILLPLAELKCVFGKNSLQAKFHPQRPAKTLKVWFQEWGISPLRRQQIPIFVYRDRVIAVGAKQAVLDELQLTDVVPCQLIVNDNSD